MKNIYFTKIYATNNLTIKHTTFVQTTISVQVKIFLLGFGVHDDLSFSVFEPDAAGGVSGLLSSV